mgnify:CR=1 FL=1
MKVILVIFLFLLQLLVPRTTALTDSIKNGIEKKFLYHKVRKGESLSSIARLYGTTERDISQFNKTSSLIFPGQKLFVNSQYRETVVSWYGEYFNGKETASGEIFHTSKILVAHKKLPLGSVVEFFNPDNRVKLAIKILDRGPFIAGREFDLSERAAQILGVKEEGVAKIIVRVIYAPSQDL